MLRTLLVMMLTLTFLFGQLNSSTAQTMIQTNKTNQKNYLITPTQGATVSNGKTNIIFAPVIVAQEFDGEKVSTPSSIILVFPYNATRVQEVDGKSKLPPQFAAKFFDKDGIQIKLPMSSYYSNSINSSYFRVFGPKDIFLKPVSLVPFDVSAQNDEPFPLINLQIESKEKSKGGKASGNGLTKKK